MKLAKMLSIVCLSLAFTSCCRTSHDVWDDTKTAGRHVKRGISALGGKHGDARTPVSREDFYSPCDDYYVLGEDFIPLPDADNCGNMPMSEFTARQPMTNPGDPGSFLPGIEAFRDPSTMQGLGGIFQNVYFEYNSNLVKGPENIAKVQKIAEYMRSNTNTYIFIEGHCDERGPEAYNLALGSRRANAVRQMLVDCGVSPDHLFTISYGKERPLIFEHHEEAFSKNRRVEFKIYQR